MSTAGWLILAGSLLVVLGLWVGFTASRLDRLHARLDAAQSALDAQLVRRVAALRHAVEAVPVPVDGAAARAAEVPGAQRQRIETLAKRALTAAGPERQAAENEVGRAVVEVSADRAALTSAQREELYESAVRVAIARRFFNDAVRDTRALR